MVQFLQTADAVRGDPGEHVLPQHQAPQGSLQPGECQGRDGVEVVVTDLQTPGSWKVIVGGGGGGNNHICLTHISQLPHRKLPQSISGQREGEYASVLQLRREVRHGDLSAVHRSQVVSGVGAETVGVELARLHLSPVQDLGGVGWTG